MTSYSILVAWQVLLNPIHSTWIYSLYREKKNLTSNVWFKNSKSWKSPSAMWFKFVIANLVLKCHAILKWQLNEITIQRLFKQIWNRIAKSVKMNIVHLSFRFDLQWIFDIHEFRKYFYFVFRLYIIMSKIKSPCIQQ